MAKPKLKALKTYLDTLDEAQLREEFYMLFNKLPQVQEFYTQELMSDKERKEMLEGYRRKIYGHFWTRTGNRKRPSNAKLRELITNYEKVAVFPSEVIDLLLYRVEIATAYASRHKGMSESNYKASYNAFKKAVEMMVLHKLEDRFTERCEAIFNIKNYDSWYLDLLKEAYPTHIN
jgi:hypothetical protein